MRFVRTAFLAAALTTLGGCAVVPPQAWNFDPTQPVAKRTASMDEVVRLTDRTAQLQLQRNEIRARIAAEPDVWKRQDLYAQLHAVGMRLSPTERELATVAAAR